MARTHQRSTAKLDRRSEGAEFDFKLSVDETVSVFTTRPDTLYGATYMVLAPEHELVTKHRESIANWIEVESYIFDAANKKEMDRLDDTKEKTGVKLEGITATNPASGEEIPVYIADYVLGSYGTGAIMAVPAHDERDYAFATKFGIEIKQVVVTCAADSNNPPQEGMEEVVRDTVIVHLRDASTGKYAVLDWHGSLEGITTAIMGGVGKRVKPLKKRRWPKLKKRQQSLMQKSYILQNGLRQQNIVPHTRTKTDALIRMHSLLR